MPTHTAGAAQWRLYIGPHWAAYTDPTYYPWHILDAGAASDLARETTLAATVTDGATTATVADGTRFTSKGGLWLGPNGSGQAWEYCPYTSAVGATISGLTREPAAARQHNGIHTSGATVRQFWAVTTDDGRLHITEEADPTYSSLAWTAEISGVVIPQAAIRNHHLAVVQWRADHGGTWTNLLIGWLDSPKVRDDAARASKWSARIVSSAQMAQLTQIPGIRAGDLDVGPYSEAAGSPGLTKAYKEWHTADITTTTATYEPANATDGDGATIYISEQYVGSRQYDTPENSNDPGRIGTNESDDAAYFGPIISQIYLSRPLGEDSKGYRWIELTCQSEDVPDLWIMTEQAGSGVAEFIDVDPAAEEYKEGDKIIICEDAELFMAEWPLTTARVFEMTNAIFDALKAGGDSIAILTSTTVSPSGDQRWSHGVSWGTASGAIDPGNPWEADPDYPGDWAWAGSANVAAPGPGQVLRYDFNGTSTDSLDYWSLTYDATPGYVVGDYTDEDDEDYDGNGRGDGNNNFGQLYPVYIVAAVPPIGLTLTDDISSADPGASDALYISGADGARPAGITAPLTIQISDEQITISALGDDYGTVTARGANGSDPQSHSAGDEIRVVETYGSASVATVGPAVKSIGWSRPAGSLHPVDFTVYYSGRETPRPPTSENFDRDWTLAATVTGHASNTYTYTLPATKRIRHVCFVITKMSQDPARVRLSSIDIKLDPAYYPADLWLDDSDTAGEIIEHALGLAGIHPDAISDTTTATPVEIVTANDRAWTIAADLAEFTGSRISVARDSKLAIAPNTIFTAGSYTPTTTWTRSNAGAVEMLWNKAGDIPRQVKLTWRTPTDDATSTATYPATADAPSDGEVLEIGPLVYADEATATTAARRIYFIARYPYQILVEAATAANTLRPLEIHRLTWDLDATAGDLDRYFVVTTADHMIERGHWQTAISGQQINREAEG